MRIFALELDNDIKGPAQRMPYIESLLAALPEPDFVALPELAACGYLASRDIWRYADPGGRETARWAVRMARRLFGQGEWRLLQPLSHRRAGRRLRRGDKVRGGVRRL